MIAELHCHTSEYSACSHVNAVELITRAFETGIQTIVITDHHYQWNDKDLTDIKKQTGLPEYFNVLAGQEFKTSDFGDILIYGLKETIKKQSLSLKDVRDKYPQAAIIWAHPFRHDKIPDEKKLINKYLNGIEIFSSNYNVAESMRALNAWHNLKFTAIAGTDTHALSYTGTYPTIFDHPFDTIEGLVEEIKSGRCRPYFKEIPRSGTTDTKVTEITIGPRSSESRKKMIVKTYEDTEAWKDGERSYHIIEKILEAGFNEGKYRVSKPLGMDEKNLSLMEEHVTGVSLYDNIKDAAPEEAKNYLKLAAGWLAQFHNMNLKITPADEYLSIEKERLDYYLSGMRENNHPHIKRAGQILNEVWEGELRLLKDEPGVLVQGHGDYHLKNIFLGKDKENNEFISAIDFNSSYQLPRAFDVGTFMAQYRNMFIDKPEVTNKAPIDLFYREYISQAENLTPNFESYVQLYKARTFLSVIYYLVKVGKGESENFWTILVEAERSLVHMAFNRSLI